MTSYRRPISLVGVCYQREPLPFLADLTRLAERAGRELEGVVVSNNPAHEFAPRVANVEIVAGSNAQLDFSGYAEGLARWSASGRAVSGRNTLFLNDSLFFKHAPPTIFRRLLEFDELLEQLQVPAIAGKLNPYRSICLGNPWTGASRYITSFCFLLNHSALPALRGLAGDASDDGVLSPNPIDSPAWGTGLDQRFREYIRAHLIYKSSSLLWPGAGAATPEFLHKKACCAYFEHRLSGAIGASGALVAINAGPRSNFDIQVHEFGARLIRRIWR